MASFRLRKRIDVGRPKTVVRLSLLGASFVFSALLLLSGEKLASWPHRVLVSSAAIGSLLLYVWDVFLWRLPIIHRANHRPYLEGIWRVTYQPTAESHIPDGGNRGPITGYFVIRQSFWFINIRSYTLASVSDSQTFYWDLREGQTVSKLTFTYENVPKKSESPRSYRHLGTCQLDPTTLSPIRITGSYFTDRYTAGDVMVELIDRTHGYSTFEEAQIYAESKAPE